MYHPAKKTFLQFCLISALATSALAQSPNLVSNGGFENPHLEAPEWFRVIEADTTTGLPSWDVMGTSVDVVSINDGDLQFAHTGTQALDLAGTPGPGAIRQSIPTVPNQTYRLTFETSSNLFEEAMIVKWDGTELGNFSTPPGSWETRTFDVTATHIRSRLEFIGVFDAAHPNEGALLDSVRLIATCPIIIPVANSDFEQPKLTMHLLVPTWSQIPGWRIQAPSRNQGIGHVAALGNDSQSVNLASRIGPGTLQQQIRTLPGRTYRVALKRKAPADSQTEVMTLKWGNLPMPVSGTAGTWRPFAINGPSALTGSTTLLELIGGTNGNVFVDSIEVTELCP